MTRSVGLDIASKKVQVTRRQDGRVVSRQSVDRSVDGHRQLVKELVAFAPDFIVMEATGVYYLDLAVALSKAGLRVSVINPRSFHHFAKLKLQGSKTDPIDADLLAEYAERMTPPAWVLPDESHLALRDLGRQINRLTASRAQAKNRLHALGAKSDTLALLIDDEREAIATLDRRIERLTLAATALLQRHPSMAQQVALLDSAKGVGLASAIALMAELCVLPRDMRAPQVVRYAGLDVRLTQSGTSVNGASRISKAGNTYLRAALYMPALSAVRFDPNARAFYEALQRRGKKKMQALCAVMRKMLAGLWACLRSQQPFDSAKLYSSIHAVKA